MEIGITTQKGCPWWDYVKDNMKSLVLACPLRIFRIKMIGD